MKTPHSARAATKDLTVVLADESHGLAVIKMRETVRRQAIASVPPALTFVKGVITLGGRVVPIIDLRPKFGLPDGFSERTCIVVVAVNGVAGRSMDLGLIVDAGEHGTSPNASDTSAAPGLDPLDAPARLPLLDSAAVGDAITAFAHAA